MKYAETKEERERRKTKTAYNFIGVIRYDTEYQRALKEIKPFLLDISECMSLKFKILEMYKSMTYIQRRLTR